jgi:hypothetical protein
LFHNDQKTAEPKVWKRKAIENVARDSKTELVLSVEGKTIEEKLKLQH